MSDDPGEIPPDIQALLDEARRPEELTQELRDRVWSRALNTAGVGSGPSPSGGVAPGKGLAAGAAKIAIAVVAGALLSAGGFLMVRARPAPPPAAMPEANALAEELAILGAARASLRDAKHHEALAHASRHQARFPAGHLSEEREAIAIRALAALGRREEAHLRADAFRKAYPDSLLLPAVNAATAGAP